CGYLSYLRRLGDREPLVTPCLESTFQHPYVVNADLLQFDGCSRGYCIAARRRIQNDVDIIRNAEMWRLPQTTRIYPESTGNRLLVSIIGIPFEVQEVEHCNLALGFQFAGEHRRTDAAQTQSTDHSQQNHSPPTSVHTDRRQNHNTEKGAKLFDPSDCNLQL